jgi:hypothetical protein
MNFVGPILSEHARRRLAQRNLSPADIDAVCQFGIDEIRAGLNCYFFGKRQLRKYDNDKQLERLVGITVLCCPRCHYVVTAYRSHRGIKDHRHKTKYARPHTVCQC